MQSFKMIFSGVTILQGVEFPIFPIDFAWALQQCSATALPVIVSNDLLLLLIIVILFNNSVSLSVCPCPLLYLTVFNDIQFACNYFCKSCWTLSTDILAFHAYHCCCSSCF